MSSLFINVSLYFILVIFLLLYFYYKSKNALQGFQQSAYSVERYLKYIKENYKYTLGINELLPLFIILIFHNYLMLCLFLITVFFYYNLQFFQISKRRYKEKVPLNLTPRVIRQIVTLIILIIIIFFIMISLFPNMLNMPQLIYSFPIFWICITYIINILIVLVACINTPIERFIQQKYKKNAIKELNKRKDILVIGITGSYGKTSIKNILNDILQEFEITLKTPSSYNTPMGISLTLNNELNNLHENFIAEMGAYKKGEIKELSDMVSPQIGIVSSIGPQHLETFKNIENIQSTKMELIEALPSNGLGILNYDNKYIRDYNLKNKVQIKWYSLENKDVDLYADDIEYGISGMKFTIIDNNTEKKYKINTRLLGKHNIYNILAAFLVAEYKEFNLDKVIKIIGTIQPVKNRLELKHINSNLTLIDDSFNGNIEGMKEDLVILSKMNTKRKILITPGIIDGGKNNSSLNKEFASNINKDITDIIFIGNYNKEALTSGINKEIKNSVKYFDQFLDGYNYAISIKESKTILIANDLPDRFNK